MTVKILGLAKLHRKLARLPDAAKADIRKAMAIAADQIVEMMKSLVPVSADGSHGNPPGTLKDSIGWTWGKAPKGATVVAAVKSSLGADLTITIYAGNAEAFYARWLEFGTQKMTKQPYFYVSWRANRRRARSAINKAVATAAKKVAANG